MKPDNPEKARELLEAARIEERSCQQLYEEKGWVPAPNLDALDEPRAHAAAPALRPRLPARRRSRSSTPSSRRSPTACSTTSSTTARCEFVAQFAVPLPLYVIGRQIGVPEEDMPQIKAWTDAWVQRLGLLRRPRSGSGRPRWRSRRSTTSSRSIERLRESPTTRC